MSWVLVLLAPLVPLAILGGLAIPPFRHVALRLAPWAAAPALAIAVFGSSALVEFTGLLLGARFGLDETGRVFLGATALIWLAAGVFARGEGARFFGFFLPAMAGNLVVVVALDAPSFQLGYALMGLSAYGLVVAERTPAALAAGRLYLALVILGEVAIFSGAALLYPTAETPMLRDLARAASEASSGTAAVVLLLAGFAIKSGIVPFHLWMPPAYTAAPAAGRAALAGAMINAGVLGWIRFLPLGVIALPELGAGCAAVGLVGAFYGVMLGMRQRDPATALAYSSVSQMGLGFLILGAALGAPQEWPALRAALVLYAVHHALAKGSLFLGVTVATGAKDARSRMLTLGGMLVPALALAGLPGTSGGAAKDALKASASALTRFPDLAGALLPVAAVGTTLLMVRVILGTRSSALGTRHSADRLGADRWIAWGVLLAVIALGAGWLPRVMSQPTDLTVEHFLEGLLPVAIGGLIAWLAVRRMRKGRLSRASVAVAGARWIAFEARIGKVYERFRDARPDLERPREAARRTRWYAVSRLQALSRRWEGRLTSSVVAGTLFVGLAVLLFALLAMG